MRQVCYSVAMSLDGYVAGPNGEADWIVLDPDIDFTALFARFDALLMGRRTFEVARVRGAPSLPGMRCVVVSRTLRPEDHPDVTILGTDLGQEVARLRESPGKDIWLFGGGSLFRSLLDLNLVDSVEVAVIPVLLGNGIPLLPQRSERTRLRLVGHRTYRSGIVSLQYAVEPKSP
jgi:dihydrofolate reductase